MKFEIKCRFTAKILFETEAETLRIAVEKAVSAGANLYGADLSGANLYGADLSRANLSGADLSRANLYGADLSRANLSGADLSRANLYGADLSRANLYGANLYGANLYGADLSRANLYGADLSRANLYGADLSGADLSRANLYGADLSGADLSRANLYGADLSGADLSRANLSRIKEDFLKVLTSAKNEILDLYEALMCGNIDGSVYEGACACLVGTIANIRKEKYTDLSINLKPDSSRPIERWFTAVRKGDIPQNNLASKIASEWMREFMIKEQIKYPEYKIVKVQGDSK